LQSFDLIALYAVSLTQEGLAQFLLPQR
jgi:hypothetical protein